MANVSTLEDFSETVKPALGLDCMTKLSEIILEKYFLILLNV